MILLYEGNTKGICKSAYNAAPAIQYLMYYKFSTTFGISWLIFKSSGAISKVQKPVP